MVMKTPKTIDAHDPYRQGVLKIEEHWFTNKWWYRMFATMVGVIITDASFLYIHESNKFDRSGTKALGYIEFIAKVALQLINYDSNISRNNIHPFSMPDFEPLPFVARKSKGK